MASVAESRLRFAYGADDHDRRRQGALVASLGADQTAAIGNGRNDVTMLRVARLGISIIGPEGGATEAVLASDLVCRSITEALDLLLDDRLVIATLRA